MLTVLTQTSPFVSGYREWRRSRALERSERPPAADSSENDQGSMNLASKTAPLPSTTPFSVAVQPDHCVPDSAQDAFDRLPGICVRTSLG